ncbi:hypothetical protein AIOL_002437 [Candidatus Rhodobacter oscarellae]|uniref:Uncharacterized protein n=1 Tax=Candidatus Rhodobacter oscarellae TaxID=1675527 RepID=A0A0J9E427_9RHOB|nr:hypothetical protein [Candidatus Rhodobacter lobularis]KMW57472.1 hypothetical protein AIOL_002437 [Candidatus Rhodobacter lobularis]
MSDYQQPDFRRPVDTGTGRGVLIPLAIVLAIFVALVGLGALTSGSGESDSADGAPAGAVVEESAPLVATPAE